MAKDKLVEEIDWSDPLDVAIYLSRNIEYYKKKRDEGYTALDWDGEISWIRGYVEALADFDLIDEEELLYKLQSEREEAA